MALVKKSVLLTPEEWTMLQKEGARTDRSESYVLRDLVAGHFKIPRERAHGREQDEE